MGKVLVDESSLQDIASAIREVISTDNKYLPSEMGNTVRDFANDLINQSNATTGKEDKDLASAVESLVEGFRQGGSGGEDYGLQLLNKTITEIPQAWKDDVTEIKNYAFYGCNQLTNATFLNCTTIGLYGFSRCENLEVANFPSLTSLERVSNNGRAFEGCGKLHTFIAPLLEIIPSYSFTNCNNLKYIDCSNVTKVLNWGFSSSGIEKSYLPKYSGILLNNTYTKCNSLKIVDLPLISSIEHSAFVSTTLLETLILSNPTMVTLSNINAFTDSSIAKGTGYVYVPKALIEDYKVATNWTTYANQFRAIEDYRDIIEPIFTENGHEYEWGGTE